MGNTFGAPSRARWGTGASRCGYQRPHPFLTSDEAKTSPRGGMSRAAYAALQIFPVFLYHTLAYALILLGAYALIEDGQVVNDACGKAFHLFKFCGLNLFLWTFACLSYCLWKGGGEGARARAMVLTILYSAFTVWGCLLWQELSRACTEVFNKQFRVIFTFHHAATFMDGVAAVMFF